MKSISVDDFHHAYEHELATIVAAYDSGLYVPQIDWDTIWVLSGPEFSLFESGEHSVDDQGNVVVMPNQTAERLHCGVSLVRNIAVLRLHQSQADVGENDLLTYGPQLFYNGGTTDEAVQTGRLTRTEQIVREISEEQLLPTTSLLTLPQRVDVTIRHTGDQFLTFPQEILARTTGKVIVVTHLYHIPRVWRYIRLYLPDVQERFVIYPATIDRWKTREATEPEKIMAYFGPELWIS